MGHGAKSRDGGYKLGSIVGQEVRVEDPLAQGEIS